MFLKKLHHKLLVNFGLKIWSNIFRVAMGHFTKLKLFEISVCNTKDTIGSVNAYA